MPSSEIEMIWFGGKIIGSPPSDATSFPEPKMSWLSAFTFQVATPSEIDLTLVIDNTHDRVIV